ncbi:MAG: bifunctional metallophosphatase/5'-nucleotidase [Anaerolineae bacterium]|jgi:2',3'-cyclic-nucleotide 2'-phosphodiesterase (5'-nucleotidase family)
MKARRVLTLLWVVLAAAGCASPAATSTPVPTPTATPTVPKPFALTIVYTNDGWGYTEPCACDPSVGGLARRAAYIESVRAEAQNVLVVDAGDSLLSLQHIGDREQGRLLAEAFNHMGYDAVTLGGLDFRMGLDVLREQMQVADYAVLSANTLDPETKEPLAEPYVIVERAGRRIALIGLTDAQITSEVTQGNVPVLEPVAELVDIVDAIQDQADVIVVLSHLGFVFDMNLQKVAPEIDVIVSGRDGEVYDPPLTAAGPIIVSAGNRGEYVGRLDLSFDANAELQSFDGHVQILTDEVPDDPQMRQWMAQSGLVPATALKSGNTGELNK